MLIKPFDVIYVKYFSDNEFDLDYCTRVSVMIYFDDLFNVIGLNDYTKNK